MLGDRYGWVPKPDAYDAGLIEERPWLNEHRGGKSVTELEILHGVLNDPAMAGRALFYFRDPAYARKKGGDYVSTSAEDSQHLEQLKDRIRASSFPVVESYVSPQALAERLEADLWALLDEAFPAEDVPDPFTREQRKHEAYAAPRRRLYLGANRYMAALDTALGDNAQRVLITGQSGGGKSALIANWLEGYRKAHPQDRIHKYFLGGSADAANPAAMVRHLAEHIKRETDSADEIPADPQALFDSLPTWLAYASSHASKEGYRWVITLDGLNGLTDLSDLRWFPTFLPECVHVVISCLHGEVLEALKTKGQWQEIEVAPLDAEASRELLRVYLARYNKALATDLEARALAHPQATNPLFLRTLAEELRLFGSHEELSDRLDHYLTSITVDDLFERVLERVEGDCGKRRLQTVMTALWASRAGLTEQEILEYAKLVPATWAPIRLALDEALIESGGRITFAHDYMRLAVSDRYMAGNNELGDENQSLEALALRRKAHAKLARWFEAHAFQDGTEGDVQSPAHFTIDDARAAEEIPYQWKAAKNWHKLQACLTKRDMFEATYACRSNEELLGYWLAVETNTSTCFENAYAKAWNQWALNETAIEIGDLASNLQIFLSFSGKFSPFTLKLAHLSLELDEKLRGFETPAVAVSLNNLAALLRDMGDYAAAEPLFRRALAVAEKVLGPEHPETGASYSNLAGLLYHIGDYAAAEPLFLRALAIAEKAQGPEHPSTGTSLNNLAVLLRDIGDCARAEALLRRALAIYEKTLGPNHISTGGSLDNLAILLKNLGDYASAEPLYRRALAIAEKSQGPEHPSTGTTLNNLAGLLYAMGDYTASEPLFRRALAIAEKTQGPEHPDTGNRLNGLALLLKNLGDYASAEPLYRRALAIAEKSQGPEHPDTGNRLSNLAGLLYAMGDYAAAEPLFRRALAIAEKTQGPEHPDTGNRLNGLALLLKNLGDYASAEPLYRRALAIAEQSQGPEHPETGTSINNLAGLLYAKGDYAAAEPLFRRALAVAEKTQGPEHPQTGTSLNNLALMLKIMGDYASAAPLYRRALDIAEKSLGPEHPATIAKLTNLAYLLQEMGDYVAAEPLFRRALAISEKLRGANHPEVGNIVYGLGNILVALGRFDEAELLFRREISIIEKSEGTDCASVGISCHQLGVLLRNAGRLDEAEVELQKALVIREKLDPHSADLSYTLSALGKLYALRGDMLSAHSYYDRSLTILRAQADPDENDIRDVEQRIAELGGD